MINYKVLLQSLSEYSIIVPILVALLLIKRLDRNSFLVLLLLIIASVPQLAARVLKVNEMKLASYNIYTLLDFVIWAYMYYANILNKNLKPVTGLLTLGFLITFFYTSIAEGIGKRFFSEMVCLSSIAQIIFILSYCYDIYLNEQNIILERTPLFWFSLGLLIYAPVTYFYFAFYSELGSKYRFVHNILNTLMYLIFALGMYANKLRSPKTAA